MSTENDPVRRLEYDAALKIMFPVPVFLNKALPVPPSWCRWKKPKNDLPIDTSIDTLKARRVAPMLRTKTELERPPLNLLCPYYVVRRWIALAVADARRATEIRSISRGPSSNNLAKNIKAAEKLRDHVRGFLELSSDPNRPMFSAKILDHYRQFESEAEAASNEAFQKNLIEDLRAAAKGRSLRWVDMPHIAHFLGRQERAAPDGNLIADELEISFAILQAAEVSLDRMVQTARSLKAQIAPSYRDHDVWKGAFVFSLCHAWRTLTGVDPNAGPYCIEFMSNAYASLGGTDFSWERQIIDAVERNKAMPAGKRFDRYERP